MAEIETQSTAWTTISKKPMVIYFTNLYLPFVRRKIKGHGGGYVINLGTDTAGGRGQ